MNEFLFLIPISISLFFGVISPGPSFLLVSQTAMSKSRGHAIAASIGMGVGVMVFAALSVAGLSVLIETVPWLYLVFKIAGGLYLFFLAYKLWRSSKQEIEPVDREINDTSLLRSFIVGLLTQLSNPKTAIVFAGVFAAFLPVNPPALSFFVLPLIAFLIDAIWYSLVAVSLSTPRAQKIYQRYKNTINKLCAGFLGLVGAKLLVSQ